MTQLNNLINFSFEGKEVRTILKNNQVWIVAKDAIEAIGCNWNGAYNLKHIPAEWRDVATFETIVGVRKLVIISEAGLNFYLFRSKALKALPFQRWLAKDVVPSIKKDGIYLHPAAAEVLSRHGLKDIFDCNSPEQLEENILRYKNDNLVSTSILGQTASDRKQIVNSILSEITSTLLPNIKEVINDTTKSIVSYNQPEALPVTNMQSEIQEKIALLEREIASMKEMKSKDRYAKGLALEEKKKEIVSLSKSKKTVCATPRSIRFYTYDTNRWIALREYMEIERGHKIKPYEFFNEVFDTFQEKLLKT